MVLDGLLCCWICFGLMIDRVEVERCRRKWLFAACLFPVFWFIHPLALASALAVWLLGFVLAYLFDWFPRVERWIAFVGFSVLFGECVTDRGLSSVLRLAL